MTYVIHNGELYHFGTPGMSWYNRNYQNKDGTWTELGKERRRKEGGMSREEKQAARMEAKKAKYQKKQDKLNRKIELAQKKEETERLKMEAKYAKKSLEETKHFRKIKDNLMKKGNAEDVLKYASHFDSNELNQVLNRLRAEDAIRQLANAQKPKKKQQPSAAESINKIANTIGAAGNVIDKSTSAYNSFAKVYNSLMLDKSQKLPTLDGLAKFEKENKPGKASAELKKLLADMKDVDFKDINPKELTAQLNLIGLVATAEGAEKNPKGIAGLLGTSYGKNGGNGLSKEDQEILKRSKKFLDDHYYY